ncbi:hypothetical protein RJ640_014995 [Escallonia rubra]|uniref:Uncharacterized protein n=1 Tax=Escallonia rubra TaxID=112253 RepID=A0AA88RNN2_9ASTE|nr:hypothetical protein RJ640_014995 [Escallonia rubra]
MLLGHGECGGGDDLLDGRSGDDGDVAPSGELPEGLEERAGLVKHVVRAEVGLDLGEHVGPISPNAVMKMNVCVCELHLESNNAKPLKSLTGSITLNVASIADTNPNASNLSPQPDCSNIYMHQKFHPTGMVLWPLNITGDHGTSSRSTNKPGMYLGDITRATPPLGARTYGYGTSGLSDIDDAPKGPKNTSAPTRWPSSLQSSLGGHPGTAPFAVNKILLWLGVASKLLALPRKLNGTSASSTGVTSSSSNMSPGDNRGSGDGVHEGSAAGVEAGGGGQVRVASGSHDRRSHLLSSRLHSAQRQEETITSALEDPAPTSPNPPTRTATTEDDDDI